MKQNKLDCCVVRDLLPTYIETLTEPETTEQVSAHLEDCSACRKLEQELRSQLPQKPVPKKNLQFLKRARNNRITSALFAILSAILIIVLWYCYLFRYPNTEAGRLAAVQNYVACGEVHSAEQEAIGGDIIDTSDASDLNIPDSPTMRTPAIWYKIQKDTPVQVVSYAEVGNSLFISFTAEDDLHSRGILELTRGINGRYRPVDASYGTGYHSAVIYESAAVKNTELIDTQDTYSQVILLAVFACKDVDAVRIRYSYSYFDPDGDYEFSDPQYVTTEFEKTYPVTESMFLWAWSEEDLVHMLNIDPYYPDTSDISISGEPILLDQDGNDITEQYNNTENPSWLALPDGTDLRFIYIFMFGILVAGILAAKHILEQ